MKRTLIFGVFLGTLTCLGCAHGRTAKGLDEKLLAESATSRAGVQVETDRLIQSAPGLTDKERKAITELKNSTRAQDERLRERSNKLKAVLMKDLMTQNYDAGELELVESKITGVEHERIALLFKTIGDANVALDRWSSRGTREAEQFYDDMMTQLQAY